MLISLISFTWSTFADLHSYLLCTIARIRANIFQIHSRGLFVQFVLFVIKTDANVSLTDEHRELKSPRN